MLSDGPVPCEVQLELWARGDGGRAATPTHATRLMLTDTGRAFTPTGEHEKLTQVFRKVLNSESIKRRQRQLRFARSFLKMRLKPDEDCLTFLSEDLEAAIQRLELAYTEAGLSVRHDNNDLMLGTCWVLPTEKSLSISYLSEYVYLLRKLHRELVRAGLRGPASAADIDNWHAMSPAQRRKFAMQLYPDNQYAWRNAGGRFVVRQRKPSLPAIEDPAGCAERMYDRLVKCEVPQEVLDIDLIAKVNGNRLMEGAELSALGLAMAGFGGDEIMARNKASGPDPVKNLTIPSGVRGRIMGRLEARPHPERAGASLLDHLRELWAVGDKDALRAVPLIPSGRTGRAYGYSGLHYHMHDAWDGHVLVQSERGSRSVTSQWNRHEAIFSDVIEALRDEPTEDVLKERLLEISNTYHQKTDQTGRYAAVALRWRLDAVRLRNLRRREQEAAARRGRELAVEIPETFDDEALEEAWAAIPRSSR